MTCIDNLLVWLYRSEVGILVHTALLSCSVRHIHSPVLVQELVHFLLGSDTHHEQRTDTPPHTHMLRYHLIERCDHISDEVMIHVMVRRYSVLDCRTSNAVI